MAERKDSLVIFGLIIFVGLILMRGLYLIGQHLDQQNYERRRFYLSVAADLDRLDKIVAEGNQSKEPNLVLPSKDWAGRN
ncbi:MAG: hypothetical protein EBS53_05480 [Bacteroidetes bacterium]|nr:hypothetical protein [Bacteroidota bacterium]